MTAVEVHLCRCGHGVADHQRDGFAPQCTAARCECLRFRPGGVVTPGALTAVAAPPTLEQILQAGKRSELKRTVALAEKIAVEIHDLRGRLRDEREAAQAKHAEDERREAARRRVAELEAQLAQARKALQPDTRAASTPVATPKRDGVEMPCPEPGCDKTSATAQGLSLHRRRAHEGFNPNAAKATS